MNDEVFNLVHRGLVFGLECEGDIFPSEIDKGSGVFCEVADEYSDKAAGAEESADAGEVVRGGPVLDLLRFRFMRDATVVSAVLSEENDRWNT